MRTDGWTTFTVAEIISPERNALVGGPFGSDLVSKDYVPSGVPVIRGANMGKGRWVSGDFVFVSEEKADALSANCAKPGDLVFTQRGTIGQVALVPEAEFDRYLISQSQMKLSVDPRKASGIFLFYVFSTAEQQIYIQQNAIRTGVPHTNLGILRNTPVRLPLLGGQKAIATVLSNIDAMIELNQRINAELEGMAKLLYDYWFVQFDFPMTAAQAAAMGKPKLAGQPYRASGGKMSYNEALKRKIPEGWEAKSLARLISVTKESVNPAASPDKTFKLFSIPVFDSTGTYSLQTGSDIGSNKFIVTGNDILVSKLNPWFSRVIYTEAEIDAVCSTEFVVWQTTASWTKAFLYMVARSPEFVCFCTQSATGTSNSHKRVNPEVMMSFSVPWDPTVVQSFGERVNPILLARQINQIQNQELTQLRDWLLPMLMNGQVTVG